MKNDVKSLLSGALASALLFIFGLLVAPPAAHASPLPTYDVFQCSGPCAFGPIASSPLGAVSPTNADFQTFFAGLMPGADTFTYSWFKHGGNSSGLEFGQVIGPFSIDTQYVWNGSILSCCWIDEPFTITGLNDDQIFVGNVLGGTGAFISQGGGGHNALAVSALQLSSEGSLVLTDLGVNTNFLNLPIYGLRFSGIDNQDRIYAVAGGQDILLVPVPEPLPVSLFVMGLLALAIAVRTTRAARARAGASTCF